MNLRLNKSTYIIAEAGVNHNGSLDAAIRLIDVAASAGADAVKFQTFKSEKLASRITPKVRYQKATTASDESQLDMLKRLELTTDDHFTLLNHCMKVGIQFLSTPFDLDSVDFLVDRLNVPQLKISSGDVTNAPLLYKAARSGKSMILSTGMATLGEVEAALGVIAFGYTQSNEEPKLSAFQKAFASDEGQRLLRERVVLLHCTTEYPVELTQVNLRAMDTLADAFGLRVGFSDHTMGINVAVAAVARGAEIVEKHFTLDRSLPGPDHKASLTPDELKALVAGIREIDLALGNGIKRPTSSERANKDAVRKGLIATKPIAKGELLTPQNMTVKRPCYGASAMLYWDYLGRTASSDFNEDEPII